MDRERATIEQIVEWTTSLSNWGRWGADDTLGTLNLVTPEVRMEALRAVQDGRTISCALTIDPSKPGLAGFARRFMVNSGEGLRDEHRVLPASRLGGTGDEMHIRAHGLDITHLDALCHISWDGRMYNGRPAEAVSTAMGATQLGIETLRGGIVTRGVLLDVASARGVVSLDPSDDVFPADLEAAEARQGVRVQPGDALLLRTGFGAYRELHPEWTIADGQPSWQAACLPWLRERDVAMIGHDGGGESFPTGYADPRLPVHAVAITAMGLWMLDNCALEELRAACASDERWTFLFVVAPIPFTGATGCAVNPLAVR